jgi:flotillin
VTFRDDRSALRDRVEDLEQELARAKAEIDGRAETAPAPGKSGRAVSTGLGALGLILAVVLFLAGVSMGGRAAMLLGMAAGLVLSLAWAALIVARCLVVVAPNQLAVLSGRRHQLADGTVIGFRLLRGGRVLRIPILEQVDFMDLSNRSLTIEVRGCYAKRGERVNVECVANVKVAGEMPLAQNAVERFLGHDESVALVARETIEGALRGVVAEFEVDELRQNPDKAAESLTEEAEHDLSRLGLILDTLRIRGVEPA